MHSKNHRKRIILVLLLTLALCAGTWSGAYHNALLSSYAVTEEEKAQAENYDYFTTTLSISPLKDAQLLNAIGRELSEKTGVPYLYSDFKKRNGYRRSVELSAIYGLYRQDYCGCAYSRAERERIKNAQDINRQQTNDGR